MIDVLYFGIAQEIAAMASEEFDAPDTESLMKKVLGKHPGLKNVVFRLALNGNMLEGDALLDDNDKVAILPPFAGG